jgi:hypothetical protein
VVCTLSANSLTHYREAVRGKREGEGTTGGGGEVKWRLHNKTATTQHSHKGGESRENTHNQARSNRDHKHTGREAEKQLWLLLRLLWCQAKQQQNLSGCCGIKQCGWLHLHHTTPLNQQASKQAMFEAKRACCVFAVAVCWMASQSSAKPGISTSTVCCGIDCVSKVAAVAHKHKHTSSAVGSCHPSCVREREERTVQRSPVATSTQRQISAFDVACALLQQSESTRWRWRW